MSDRAEIITSGWKSQLLSERRGRLFISQVLVVCSAASRQGQRVDNQIVSVCGSFKRATTNLPTSNRWTEEDLEMSLTLSCHCRANSASVLNYAATFLIILSFLIIFFFKSAKDYNCESVLEFVPLESQKLLYFINILHDRSQSTALLWNGRKTSMERQI